MFDITTPQRKRIYAWIQSLSALLATVSAVLTPVSAAVTDGALAPILASILAVVGVVGTWVAKLAKDHTGLDALFDAVDPNPDN